MWRVGKALQAEGTALAQAEGGAAHGMFGKR